MDARVCPPPDELRAYSLGLLPDADAARVADHLDRCPVCQQAAESLDTDGDELLAALRRPAEPEPYADEPEYRDLVARAEALPAPVEAVPESPVGGRLGPYRLAGRLGAGGMGVVYEAVHERLGKTVAVKVLSTRRLADPESVARFLREVRMIGRLDHPNIVQATDAGEDAGGPYLVMEFVRGVDAATLLRRSGPLPVREACEVVRQAALGVQHAHDAGLVHRDVKPSNLILTAAGVVKVLDLGLALLRAAPPGDELTAEQQVMGTFDYMAPEQAANAHRVDARADVYSLGCTLHHLLTGRPPFADPSLDTTVKKLWAHATQPAPSLAETRPDAPPELGAVLVRMLAKVPADRPPTAAAVAEALAPFAAGADLAALPSAPAASPPAPAAAPSSRPPARRSRRTLWFAGALALALVGGVLVVALWPSRPGTLVIDIDDPQTLDQLRGKELVIRERGGNRAYRLVLAGPETIQSLPPGEYTITLPADADAGQFQVTIPGSNP